MFEATDQTTRETYSFRSHDTASTILTTVSVPTEAVEAAAASADETPIF